MASHRFVQLIQGATKKITDSYAVLFHSQPKQIWEIHENSSGLQDGAHAHSTGSWSTAPLLHGLPGFDKTIWWLSGVPETIGNLQQQTFHDSE